MRIAQVANFVGPASGGMKTALDALGRGYHAAGAQRMLIVPGPVDEIRLTEAGRVVQVRAPRVGGGYRLIVEPWRVIDVLESFAPTSVELSDKTTLLPVALWARRNDVASILFSHERLDDMFSMRLGRASLDTGAKVSIKLLNRVLVRSFDRIVVTSDYAEREFRTLADSVDCPIAKVPLGVDLDTFHPRRRRSSSPSEIRLVHVGRLSREKSPHLAVATAVELHRRGLPVRLDVFGEGPHEHELREIAGSAPVHFRGFVGDRTALAEHIAAADVSLSVCPGETFGLAVLEALACGTPVVTADIGGASELVDAASGAIGAPHPHYLADAVERVLARPRATRRSAARRRAEQFDWRTSVEAMLELHQRVEALPTAAG